MPFISQRITYDYDQHKNNHNAPKVSSTSASSDYIRNNSRQKTPSPTKRTMPHHAKTDRRRSSTVKGSLFNFLNHSHAYDDNKTSDTTSNSATTATSLSNVGHISRKSTTDAIPTNNTVCIHNDIQQRNKNHAVPPCSSDNRADGDTWNNTTNSTIPRNILTNGHLTDITSSPPSTNETCSSVTDNSSADNLSSNKRSTASIKFNNKQFLKEYLNNWGFLNPKELATKRDEFFKMYIATSGDNVFLPTISSNDDEYLARLNGLQDEEDDILLIEGIDLSTGDSHGRNTNSNGTGPSRHESLHNADDVTAEQLSEIHTGTALGGDSEVNGSRVPLDADEPRSSSPSSLEMDNSMVALRIAVIISLNKETALSDIEVELCSRVKIFWNNGVPPTKTFNEEFYTLGATRWSLNQANFNLYIPPHVSSTEQIIENNSILRENEVFKNMPVDKRVYLDKTKSRKSFMNSIKATSRNRFKPGDYIFVLPVLFSNDVPESIYLPSARVSYKIRVGTKFKNRVNQNNRGRHNNSDKLQVSSSASSLNVTEMESTQSHKYVSKGLFKKVKNHLHIQNQSSKNEDKDVTNELLSEYPIHIIRTPPPISISTANKPIFINRVWTDSLAYEISFSQKYVPLNNEIPIKIKLAPMVKNICVKRIRVSITEKITFVSKNYEFEYDQVDPVAKDPYNPYYLDFASKRRKERNLNLLEIRTKEKGARAMREEIVENCYDDNLLSYSTIDTGSVHSKNEEEKKVGITEPIIIETKLEFPKYADLARKSAKVTPPYGIDIYTNVPTFDRTAADDHHRSSVISFLSGHKSSFSSTKKNSQEDGEHNQHENINPRFRETRFRTNSGTNVKHHTKLNRPKRGLYLDSLHFSNIHCKHKLEIMLRISKPDLAIPGKLRHYEVLIDTPIFLVSELCNSGNMELPTYDMATSEFEPLNEAMLLAPPPAFEEAISVPASPIGSPDLLASYEPDLSSIQQLSLSRSTSISSQGGQLDGSNPVLAGPSTSPIRDGDDLRFNNLDKLLASPVPSGGRSNAFFREHRPSEDDALFKEDYSMAKPTRKVPRQIGGDRAIDDDAVADDGMRAGSHSPITEGHFHSPPNYDDIVSR
ncbi:Ecm21p NDAI_0E04570 [Naumovozyma dairenensis CBS 421]|uniref:Arrestin C-terminal-like domain-containing protein n=1 Tax=Naumovozyma dairenensis (strain ATCC 10597 / BCRC 20456 / CBS 421 / NBRC 0211 / NRRL Y-12639) TaxID=1071378 RepID=G0WC04_NAUDC|nr:hypothetical protein NDAI_0E04570 [Naumovozyma dairenensis CBS 421]CCD25274.1 hypothetical protein NDAI_0E04570 [Naumovozyma dairenensis CBS 421]